MKHRKRILGIVTPIAAGTSIGTYYFANALYGGISSKENWSGISGHIIAIMASIFMFFLLTGMLFARTNIYYQTKTHAILKDSKEGKGDK